MMSTRLAFVISSLVLAGCDVHYNLNGRSSGGSPSSPQATNAPTTEATPAPVEEAPPPAPSSDDRPSKRGNDGGGYDEAQQQADDGEPLKGKPASSSWDGKYVDLSERCDAKPAFDPKGKDDQTVSVDRWGYNGFVCPGTCANREPLVVANGKATFSLLWVDDFGAGEGLQKLSVHRQRFTVTLVETEKNIVASKTVQSIGQRTWYYHDQAHTSNQALTLVALGVSNDAHEGYGRTGVFDIRVGRDGKFAEGNEAASCARSISRTDFKLGDGGSDADTAEGQAGRCKQSCRRAHDACSHSCNGTRFASGCKQSCLDEETTCKRGC